MVTPSRFFGLNPSRRASFSTSGEGSEEASVAVLAGFEPAAVESVLAAGVGGAAADGEGADGGGEVGVADDDDDDDAGDCAAHGTAAATVRMSDAKRAVLRVIRMSPGL
jgi:hypothetical protein